MRNELVETIYEQGRVTNFEVPIRKDDGAIIWIQFSGTLSPEDGFFEGVVADITARRQAEEALRESEEKFRTLVEESPLGISLIQRDGRYTYVNPAFRKLFGYTIEDISTGDDGFGESKPTKTGFHQLVPSWTQNTGPSEAGQLRSRVYTVTCKDGSRKEIHSRSIPLDNRDTFVIYEDITERSRMERQFQEAQKFEAIGTLAGGVAHDFNNLLMGIQGRASLMAAEMDPDHLQREHLEAIESYVRSATTLTRQLLGFARGGKYEVKPVDFNELVSESASMFGRTRKEIRVHTKCRRSPLVVEVDRRQIEHVLLNMYVNAWQAMPDGGELFLESRMVRLGDAFCKPHQVEAGPYAKVSITDNGSGMDEATRQRIFDPFFSTKEKGRGTGLGLASAYGIIKNHAGLITVNSEVGLGTTFSIYLPLSNQEALCDNPSEEGLIKGSGTILLVDDEEMIINVSQAMLKKLGYTFLSPKAGSRPLTGSWLGEMKSIW